MARGTDSCEIPYRAQEISTFLFSRYPRPRLAAISDLVGQTRLPISKS